MPENKLYPPEGLSAPVPLTLSALRDAQSSGAVLEAAALRCDAALCLHFQFGSVTARMPREEVTAPWITGAGRDIAVLSRVGKPVCFTVMDLSADAKGAPVALLSRKQAQEDAITALEALLRPGAVVTGRIVGMEPFGAFVDIGRGIVALLPTAYISAARIRHPRERFQIGQKILAVVKSLDRASHRITLTHRELLGTWLENASLFAPGDTVQGIVRGIQDYGAFIELTPNLSGLTDRRDDLHEGDAVSVNIRSLRPERMKVKLQVIERLPPLPAPEPLRYWITDGVLERWVYSPANFEGEAAETVFTPVP